MITEDRAFFQYKSGDLVYTFSFLPVSCAQVCAKYQLNM